MVDSADEQPEPNDVGLLECEFLRTVVPVMRELGVVEFEGLRLGVPPKPIDLASQVFGAEQPNEEQKAAAVAAFEARKRALFYKAAS